MEDKIIPEGAIILARQVRYSDIWITKPAWWFKVWTYLILKANHEGKKGFKKGTNFFTREMIFEGCFLSRDRIKKETVDNAIRWMRNEKMLTTQKTTRGFIITILKYETYQSLKNYKNDRRNDGRNETETTQERHRNDTINNNDNNDKNEKKKEYKNIFSFWNSQNLTQEKSCSEINSKIEKLLNEFLEDEIIQGIKNYSEILKSDETFFKHTWTLYEFLSKPNAFKVFIKKSVDDYLIKPKNKNACREMTEEEAEEKEQMLLAEMKKEKEKCLA